MMRPCNGLSTKEYDNLMGYHILLYCTAIIKPEYIDHIKLDYFWCGINDDYDYDEDPDHKIPDAMREYYSIWRKLHINSDGSTGFYQCKMEGDRFIFELCKRPYFYPSRNTYITLEDDYRRFMLYFIAPISSEILRCEIEHDDFGDQRYTYTDEEVRNFHIT